MTTTTTTRSNTIIRGNLTTKLTNLTTFTTQANNDDESNKTQKIIVHANELAMRIVGEGILCVVSVNGIGITFDNTLSRSEKR